MQIYRKISLNSKTITLKFLLIFLSIIILTSCKSNNTDNDNKLLSLSDIKLYQLGIEEIKKDRPEAIAKFNALEQSHPYSSLVPNAQVMKAYGYYKQEKFDESIDVIDSFNQSYPKHKYSEYMYYLKALCYYDQMVDIGRDQKITEQAKTSLLNVIEYFPHSAYSKDAKWKLDYVFNALAAKEMSIGRFYSKAGNNIAAIVRFKTVIDLYDTSMFIPEALYRLAYSYRQLGILTQAKIYALVLTYNFPDNYWTDKVRDISN